MLISTVLINSEGMCEAEVFLSSWIPSNVLIIALILILGHLSDFVRCECRFLTDSNKSASVRAHVAQNETREVRTKTAKTEFCRLSERTVCLMKTLNFILYSSVLKRRTLKMKITKCCKYYVNILNSELVTVSLSGYIDRESNGGDALFFLPQNWMHFHCELSVPSLF